MSSRKRSRDQLISAGRRRFLSNSASGAMGAAIALASGKKGWYAYADAQAQQSYMINIHLPGGWDTHWFHCAYPKSRVSTAADNINLIRDLPSSLYNASMEKPPSRALAPNENLDPFGRRVDATTSGEIKQYYSDRYTERTRANLLAAHPGAAGHYFGLAAQNAFAGDLSLLSQKALILKGVASGGAHLIPNTNIIHGSASQYAISFSGLSSAALALRQGKRKLHYMQLTNTPADYGANWAMAKGDQIPINCPDHDAFTKLIRRPEADFADATAYDAVNASVAKLGNDIGKSRLSLNRSKNVYSAFVDNFKSAITISQLGTSMGGFLAVWAEYANYARERVLAVHSAGFVDGVSSEVALPFQDKCYNTHFLAPYMPSYTMRGATTPMTDAGASNPHVMYPAVLAAYTTALGAPFTADEASLNLKDTSSRAFIAQCAWKFALAEYLITQGHTTVVDMVFSTGDHHAANDDEVRLISIYYSLYARLLKRLNDQQSPVAGKSFLDRTLVSMFSEFDRTPNLDVDTSKDNRGTGHGSTESILFAGYGIKQGKVVGDVLNNLGQYMPTAFEYKPGKTGVVNYQYIFPTILKIMGVEIPANQITDAEAILAVIAGY
jgi:hypothetical protein